MKAVWDLVIEDMRERDRIGLERYGKRLGTDTEIDTLEYAYEEALDLAVYLKKEIVARQSQTAPSGEQVSGKDQ